MKFLVDTIRGLNPTLPPTSKLQKAKDAVDNIKDAMQGLFDLKSLLQKQHPAVVDQTSTDDFFEQHFKEVDPNLIPEMCKHVDKCSGSFNSDSGSSQLLGAEN